MHEIFIKYEINYVLCKSRDWFVVVKRINCRNIHNYNYRYIFFYKYTYYRYVESQWFDNLKGFRKTYTFQNYINGGKIMDEWRNWQVSIQFCTDSIKNAKSISNMRCLKQFLSEKIMLMSVTTNSFRRWKDPFTFHTFSFKLVYIFFIMITNIMYNWNGYKSYKYF